MHTLMREHGVRGIAEQDDFATHKNPLIQRLAVVETPFARLRTHALDDLFHHRIPALVFFLEFGSRGGAGPTLVQVAELVA